MRKSMYQMAVEQVAAMSSDEKDKMVSRWNDNPVANAACWSNMSKEK